MKASRYGCRTPATGAWWRWGWPQSVAPPWQPSARQMQHTTLPLQQKPPGSRRPAKRPTIQVSRPEPSSILQVERAALQLTNEVDWALGAGTLFCLCSWACELSIFDAGGGSGFAAMRGGTPLQDGSSYQEGSYEHSGSGGWGLDDEEEGAKKRGRKVRPLPPRFPCARMTFAPKGLVFMWI